MRLNLALNRTISHLAASALAIPRQPTRRHLGPTTQATHKQQEINGNVELPDSYIEKVAHLCNRHMLVKEREEDATTKTLLEATAARQISPGPRPKFPQHGTVAQHGGASVLYMSFDELAPVIKPTVNPVIKPTVNSTNTGSR